MTYGYSIGSGRFCNSRGNIGSSSSSSSRAFQLTWDHLTFNSVDQVRKNIHLVTDDNSNNNNNIDIEVSIRIEKRQTSPRMKTKYMNVHVKPIIFGNTFCDSDSVPRSCRIYIGNVQDVDPWSPAIIACVNKVFDQLIAWRNEPNQKPIPWYKPGTSIINATSICFVIDDDIWPKECIDHVLLEASASGTGTETVQVRSNGMGTDQVKLGKVVVSDQQEEEEIAQPRFETELTLSSSSTSSVSLSSPREKVAHAAATVSNSTVAKRVDGLVFLGVDLNIMIATFSDRNLAPQKGQKVEFRLK